MERHDAFEFEPPRNPDCFIKVQLETSLANVYFHNLCSYRVQNQLVMLKLPNPHIWFSSMSIIIRFCLLFQNRWLKKEQKKRKKKKPNRQHHLCQLVENLYIHIAKTHTSILSLTLGTFDSAYSTLPKRKASINF